MSREISVRPADILDPYHEEDSITRFAIDLITLIIDSKAAETEKINIEESEINSELRKRDLEWKQKYNITLEEARKMVFGSKDGGGRRQ